MKNIKDYFNKPVKKIRSERAGLIQDIYDIYISQIQRNFRKKENWKRYVIWLKENRTPNSKEAQAKFKKSKKFIKEHNIKSICVFLSPIPTADLYYIVSMARDMQNRSENFSGYLLGALMGKEAMNKEYPQEAICHFAMRNKREVKLWLLNKYNKCYWCSREVKDYGNREDYQKLGIKDPDDMATIDHLVSRYFRKKGEIVPKVLACYKCNTERAIREDRLYGINKK